MFYVHFPIISHLIFFNQNPLAQVRISKDINVSISCINEVIMCEIEGHYQCSVATNPAFEMPKVN